MQRVYQEESVSAMSADAHDGQLRLLRFTDAGLRSGGCTVNAAAAWTGRQHR